MAVLREWADQMWNQAMASYAAFAEQHAEESDE
jgi:hypothetical protein